MKIVIYKHEDIQTITSLINSVNFRGFEQARLISEIGRILDLGEIRNRHEGGDDLSENT